MSEQMKAMLMKRGDDKNLYPHQVNTLGLLFDKNKVALYLDMGL